MKALVFTPPAAKGGKDHAPDIVATFARALNLEVTDADFTKPPEGVCLHVRDFPEQKMADLRIICTMREFNRIAQMLVAAPDRIIKSMFEQEND